MTRPDRTVRARTSTAVAHRHLAAGVVAAGTAGFLALSSVASRPGGLSAVDSPIARFVEHDRSAVATTAARAFTWLGSEPVLAVATLVLLVVLLVRRRLPDAVALAVAMAGSAALTVGVKLAVGRTRPGGALRLGPVDHTFSFPSGHTLNSAVLLAMVGLVVVPVARHRTRPVAWCLLGALAVGVGVSRVYLGYHWFTDVAGSWVIATTWVTAVMIVRSVVLPPVTPAVAEWPLRT